MLVPAESMQIPPVANVQRLPFWTWVCDPAWEVKSASSPPQGNEDPVYEGRLKVSWNSLFMWFYAERVEGSKTMEELWRESLMCRHQGWDTFAANGIELHAVPITMFRAPVDQYDTVRERYDWSMLGIFKSSSVNGIRLLSLGNLYLIRPLA